MKKTTSIYFDTKAVVFCLVFLGLGFMAFFNQASVTNLILLIGSGLFFILSLVYSRIPLWSYNSRGFEKKYLSGTKNYKWSDIKYFSTNKLLDGFYFKTFDNKYFSIQAMVTKDFSRCGKEVLQLILENNPQLKIPASFIKRMNEF